MQNVKLSVYHFRYEKQNKNIGCDRKDKDQTKFSKGVLAHLRCIHNTGEFPSHSVYDRFLLPGAF